MPDEATIKGLAVAHCLRINDKDVAGLLRLYAPDVRFEDPVGSGVRTGHAALRAHAAQAIAAGVCEIPGEPVGALDGRHAALPVTGLLPYVPGSPLLGALGLAAGDADPAGKVLRVDYVMVIGVGERGLVEEMRSYWGPSSVSLVDRTSVPWDDGAPRKERPGGR